MRSPSELGLHILKITTSNDLLNFWQENYGKLTPKNCEKFLNHPDLKSILSFDSYSIKIAIKRNKKLSDALGELAGEIGKKSGRGGKIENREIQGGRWGRNGKYTH